MERELGHDLDRESGGFDESLAEVANALRGVALRATKDPNEAADLLQDTLLSALESRERFDAKRGELLPWLFGVLSNHIRRRHRRAAKSKLEVLDDVPAPEGCDPLEQREAESALSAALAELPADTRRLLDLRLRDGLNSTEIGEVLGIPASTVRVRLKRAVARLRKQLPPTLQVLALAYLASCSASPGPLPGPATRDPEPPTPPTPLQAAPTARRLALAATAVVAVVGTWFVISTTVGGAPPAAVPAQPPSVAAADAAEARGETGTATERVAVAKAPPAVGQVRLRVHWDDTGEPAAGVSLRLLAPDVPGVPGARLGLLWRSVTLDDQGEAVLDDVPVGPACVFADDGRVRVDKWDVQPGKQTRPFKLEPVHHIQGEVVDHTGAPVADAEIWCSSTGGRGTPGFAATRTSPDGSFEVAAFHRDTILWATAPGHAMSLQNKASVWERRLRLVLGAQAVTLTGQLVDERGQAIPGGLVCVRNTEVLDLPQVVYATSDPSGRFEFRGLHPGLHVIAAVAEHRAPMWQRVRLSHGAPQDVPLVLTRGATIEGTVSGVGAIPHESLRVLVFHRDNLEVGLGILVASAAFGPDGHFCVTNAPTGSGFVRISYGRGGHRNVVVSLRGFYAVEGQKLRCDQIVDASAWLEGEVVDEGGKPFPGYQIEARPQASYHKPNEGTLKGFTDPDGRFKIPVAERELFDCYVFSPSSTTAAGILPSAVEKGVAPGTAVTIQIARAALPSAELSGRVLEHDGLFPADAYVWVATEDGLWFSDKPVDPTTGEFAFGPLPPGTHRLGFARRSAGPCASHFLGWITLRPDQPLDLGDIRIPGTGTVRLRVERPGPDAGSSPVWIRFGIREVEVELGRELELTMREGQHELRYVDDGCRQHVVPFRVVAGACTELKLPMQPARPCRLEFRVEPKAGSTPLRRGLRVELTDDQNRRLELELGERRTLHIALRPGVYTVEAHSPSRGEGRHTFVVEDTGDGIQEVTIWLR